MDHVDPTQTLGHALLRCAMRRGVMLTRRELMAGCLGASALARASRSAAQTPRTRLVLLGTGGGPRPKKTASASANAVVVDDVVYVVDCGDGVARQLVMADLPLTSLRHVFITHQHSDHNADYGNLLLLAWAAGLKTRVDTWGPPPLEKMTTAFFEMNAYDITTRISDEGRVPLVPLVQAHNITNGGVVMQDDRVKVTAALVNHPPVVPAFGFRFDTPDRSLVFSGDTGPSRNLVALAKGADILVHEAMWAAAVDRLVGSVANASRLKEHLLASHTVAEECGRIAEEAGVKTLVLSHFVPGGDPLITDQMWLNAAQKYFRGKVVVGRDLMLL
jgi:ribonuclease BN (tRNA processing enzyme)